MDREMRLEDNRLSVALVTHNSAHVLRACLDSLRSCSAPVIVVDNASTDDTVKLAGAAGARVILNRENRGFAAAANQAIRSSASPYILLLNPDVVVTAPLLSLLDPFERPEVAAVAATLLGSDGEPQYSFQFRRLPGPLTLIFETLGLNRLFPWNPVNRRYRYRDLDWETPGAVEQPAGAFLLLRKSAWIQAGGFDERFWPIWFEDVDYCLQLLRNGHVVWRVPMVAGVHAGGHSIKRLDQARRQLYWYRSLLQYAAKHFSAIWVRMIAVSVLIGNWRALRGSPASESGIHGVKPLIALAVETVLRGRPPASRWVSDSPDSRQES
ncbi:MAG: glycosyltransferase family 2 protein [Bryobacterales bacterium]|nr:glycosyltransferase family 2 protein [Bryobacterales bacterium]